MIIIYDLPALSKFSILNISIILFLINKSWKLQKEDYEFFWGECSYEHENFKGVYNNRQKWLDFS